MDYGADGVVGVWADSQEPYLIAKLDSAERTYKELSVSTKKLLIISCISIVALYCIWLLL